MRNSLLTPFSIICLLLMASCKTESKSSITNLTSEIENKISEIEGDIALAFLDLSNDKIGILLYQSGAD